MHMIHKSYIFYILCNPVLNSMGRTFSSYLFFFENAYEQCGLNRFFDRLYYSFYGCMPGLFLKANRWGGKWGKMEN